MDRCTDRRDIIEILFKTALKTIQSINQCFVYWITEMHKSFSTQALVFTCLQYKSFENTVCKGEIARNEQFLLCPQCFLPVWTTFCHFHQIYYCRLQILSVSKSIKFVVWERVKLPFAIERLIYKGLFTYPFPVRYYMLPYFTHFRRIVLVTGGTVYGFHSKLHSLVHLCDLDWLIE